jgi:hypothetical protein
MKAIGRIREVGMFINPKTDFAFKKIFGSKQSTDILISFLNASIFDRYLNVEPAPVPHLGLKPQAIG